MSIYEAALKLVAKNLEEQSKAWTDRIINANLSHADYIVAKAVSYTYRDAGIIVNKAVTLDPDKPLPETFIPSTGTPVQEMAEQSSEPNVHKVDIETGTVSRGSN